MKGRSRRSRVHRRAPFALTIEDVARVCHEINREYCAAIGDPSQLPWEEAPNWQRTSALSGVVAHIEAMTAGAPLGPAGSHAAWMRQKIDDGWTYGPVKDEATRQHPCIVPFESLPVEQRVKDHLFEATVRALATHLV